MTGIARAKVSFGMHDSLTAIVEIAVSDDVLAKGLADLWVSQCRELSQGPWLSAVLACEATQLLKRLQN